MPGSDSTRAPPAPASPVSGIATRGLMADVTTPPTALVRAARPRGPVAHDGSAWVGNHHQLGWPQCCMEQIVRSRSTDVESCGRGSFLPGIICLHEGNHTLFSNQSLVRFHRLLSHIGLCSALG